jgi:hypothetical protein
MKNNNHNEDSHLNLDRRIHSNIYSEEYYRKCIIEKYKTWGAFARALVNLGNIDECNCYPPLKLEHSNSGVVAVLDYDAICPRHNQKYRRQ